jgi:hypothetical protein
MVHKLTQEEYVQTVKNLYAFHRFILGNPFEASPNQILIMDGISAYLETIAIAGSKAGKSTISAESALWGVYRMLQVKDAHKKYGLTPGINLYAMNIAPKEDIALNMILAMIKGLANQSPYMSQFIEYEKREEIGFTGRIVARAQGSSSKAGRGYAIFSLILDEICSFIDTRGTLSGTEVLNAYMPRLTPFGEDGRMIAISTPAGRSGIGYQLFRTGKPIHVIQHERSHGEQPFRAVFQFPTWELNPLPQYARDSVFMKKEQLRDPWSFEREYNALFANVISAFFDAQRIDDCIDKSLVLPQQEHTQNYVITGDPGFEHGNYAIGMGHLDKNEDVIVDFVIRFEQLLNILEIENFYEDLCKRYRVVDIVLDSLRSMSTINRLESKGLPARGVRFGARTDMQLYQPLLELVNIKGIHLPNYEPLIQELKFLERVVHTDRYRVQVSPGSTDDLADVVALLAYVLKVEGTGGAKLVF